MAVLNSELRQLLHAAYEPGIEFAKTCHDMRWNPAAGHVPRGFCGATGELEDVRLVLVVAEPGDPHVGESHPADPEEALDSTYTYAYRCFRDGKDLFHRNVRLILDLCFPGMEFDEQMRSTWITESVLCSAAKEGGAIRKVVGDTCRSRYLDRQIELLPNAVVAALGSKAAARMRNRVLRQTLVEAFAAAPPGCNIRGARESWERLAEAVHEHR